MRHSVVSNLSCSSRELREVNSCVQVLYTSTAGYNDCCPITLCEFNDGESVVRLPNGHLISSAAYEEMMKLARNERRVPVDPFTRKELPPSTSAEEMRHFAAAPLEAIGLERYVTRIARSGLGQAEVHPYLSFDVSHHPDARSKVARDMLSRLVADTQVFALEHNSSSVPRCVFLPDPSAAVRDEATRAAAADRVRELLNDLADLRERDSAAVRDSLPLLVRRATFVPPGSSLEDQRQRQVFMLRQLAEQEGSVSMEYLLCLLISTTGVEDLRACNPFISEKEVEELLDAAVAAVLRANRVGQINRSMSEARGLLRLLQPPGTRAKGGDDVLGDQASRITLKSQALAEQLLARRQFVVPSEVPSDSGGLQLTYDPRFLLFEFTHNIVLRGTQVQLVREFVAAVRQGRPLVKQMLMGGGKTTVVGPMLALTLGDGDMLVLQTMPQALLEQSKATLRATFSAIMSKRVFTLVFERSSELGWDTVEKLLAARRNRGVVLCTASTIKSLQLKMLEKMDVLRDTRRKQHPSMEVDLRALVEVMKVYKNSCLIMDEVDLLLHPLKSELNFPIGRKFALDLSPQVSDAR